jgi:hypothetical protein
MTFLTTDISRNMRRDFQWKWFKVRPIEAALISGRVKDENTAEYLSEIDDRYTVIASRIEAIMNYVL